MAIPEPDGLPLPTEDGDRPPAPFIVGVNRSGTTLLRLMLDAHPLMAVPPETHFVPELIRRSRRDAPAERLRRTITRHPRWPDFGLDRQRFRFRLRAIEELDATTILRTFYELYADREGKPRWGDKTPRYMRAMPRIEKALPEARFIHLIRDGRDVALSQARRHLHDKPVPIEVAAKRWSKRITTARRQGADVGHYMEVRYEDLVAEPEAELRKVCEFIDLPFSPVMLNYHKRATRRLHELDRDLDSPGRPLRRASERIAGHAMTTQPPDASRLGRWATEMSETDVAAFEGAAGELLAELGYEIAGAAPTPSSRTV